MQVSFEDGLPDVLKRRLLISKLDRNPRLSRNDCSSPTIFHMKYGIIYHFQISLSGAANESTTRDCRPPAPAKHLFEASVERKAAFSVLQHPHALVQVVMRRSLQRAHSQRRANADRTMSIGPELVYECAAMRVRRVRLRRESLDLRIVSTNSEGNAAMRSSTASGCS
jgi:hypothetical protein